MIELTSENYEQETSTGKVIIDCWANWCGKCKMLKPQFEQLSKTNSNYKFCSLDVDTLPEITSKLNVQALPTIIIMEDGKELNRGGFEVLNNIYRK